MRPWSFASRWLIYSSPYNTQVSLLALRSATALFDVGGASAAVRDKNLDRHWRNARTLASHNPASYKARAIGALELHGTKLPDLGFF